MQLVHRSFPFNKEEQVGSGMKTPQSHSRWDGTADYLTVWLAISQSTAPVWDHHGKYYVSIFIKRVGLLSEPHTRVAQGSPRVGGGPWGRRLSSCFRCSPGGAGEVLAVPGSRMDRDSAARGPQEAGWAVLAICCRCQGRSLPVTSAIVRSYLVCLYHHVVMLPILERKFLL